MSWVACLRVPDLALAALLRAEPELADRPLAVSEGAGARAAVLAANPAARRLGVAPGMSVVQARSLLPDLALRPVAPAQVRSAQAALLDVARAFSPRVALGLADAPAGPGGGGEVFLDAFGLGRRFPHARSLGEALARAAERVGLAVRVGLGAGPLIARLAALGAAAEAPVAVVEPGAERAFLAPLPLSLLESSARLRAALERFGIDRLGQLADLPAAGLGRRLGPEGLGLWRLARGEDRRPLLADLAPERFVEEDEPGWALQRLEPLRRVLDGLLARLAERLACRGLAARALQLDLSLEAGGVDARRLEPAAPSRTPAAWGELLAGSLQQRPPPGPVVGVAVEAQPVRLRGGQQGLFERRGGMGSPELDETLGRLAALAGEERVGSPWLPAGHRPEAFRLRPLDQGGGPPGPADDAPPVALRVLRPPLLVRVLLDGRRPVSVSAGPARGRRLAGRVRRAAGPWRIAGDWWQPEPWDRDYYEVELSSGSVVRLFCDRLRDEWFIDGICG